MIPPTHTSWSFVIGSFLPGFFWAMFLPVGDENRWSRRLAGQSAILSGWCRKDSLSSSASSACRKSNYPTACKGTSNNWAWLTDYTPQSHSQMSGSQKIKRKKGKYLLIATRAILSNTIATSHIHLLSSWNGIVWIEMFYRCKIQAGFQRIS